MNILINGQSEEQPGGITIEALLASRATQTDSVAVAHNEQFVPKSSYANITLEEGDRIEIVAPMQGG